MGKISAILHTYAAVFASEKQQEVEELAKVPIDKLSTFSSSSSSMYSSSAVTLPPRVDHNSVLRDTQRLWLAATPEHRAALEIIAESKYCQGFFPHHRYSVKSVPRYCTASLTYHFPDEIGAESLKSDSYVNKYSDPSKRYALRFPKFKSAMYRKLSDPVQDSKERDLTNDDNKKTNYNDDKNDEISGKKSRPTKLERKLMTRKVRSSKKAILWESLMQQRETLMALQQTKARSRMPMVKYTNEPPPIMVIDWSKIPLPSKLIESEETTDASVRRKGRNRKRKYGNIDDDDTKEENNSDASSEEHRTHRRKTSEYQRKQKRKRFLKRLHKYNGSDSSDYCSSESEEDKTGIKGTKKGSRMEEEDGESEEVNIL